MRQSTETRFLDKIEVGGDGGHWMWTSARNENGYGVFWVGGAKRMKYAHRFAYELLVGPIGPSLEIDHLCRVRLCVNPMHLRTATGRENTLSGLTLAASNAAATHCIRGHEFTEANTYRRTNGARTCRQCSSHEYPSRQREKVRDRYASAVEHL